MLRKVLRKISAVLVSFLALILIVILIGGNVASILYGQMISVFTGDKPYEIKGGSNPMYYTSDYSSQEELNKHAKELCLKIEQEGMVLLKNTGNALPLGENSKVSLLSENSVDLVYGGTGAGSVDTSKAPDLKTAMEASNLTVNPILWDFYTKGSGSAYRKEVPGITGVGNFRAHEVPVDLYTEEVKNSFKEYSDAGIVVIGRSGGESADLTTGEKTESHYLELNSEERDLLQMACDSFEKVIVVINGTNPMELNFLEEYDVDACLWVGAVGQEGAYGIGQALAGFVNPSGRLVDTYGYNPYRSPAMNNFGDYSIINSDVANGNKYMVYSEGIYVGYRYYETRYEDVVLGNESIDNYDYTKQVQFPFGYGLSYTDFTWSDYKVSDQGDMFQVSVTVTNTGNTAGKEVVQIYMQSPYTDYDKANGIEKSAVELVGFGKTEILEPKASETVNITVDKEWMKTYDAYGYGTYIVDAGDYYLSVGKNAHDGLNNILTAKKKTVADGLDIQGNADFVWKYQQENLDSTAYGVSKSTGNKITNQFDKADIRYYDPDFKYLSRSDWEGTWPSTYAEGQMTASSQLLKDMEISSIEDAKAVPPIFDTISKEYGKLQLLDLKGADYNDPKWEALLNQIPQEEMFKLVRQGGYATNILSSINAPGTIDKDGPAGISGTLAGGNINCMAYPPEIVLASTWNVDLAKDMGRMVGEDSINTGIAVWYAPAMNIHRTAFSGRNFEYYSEDGFLSGKMGASEVEGFQQKGGIVTIKHFAVNDQETNRIGGAMFANEQSIRELYLKGFELSVREGNANGVMASMNRIGARWSGGHYGLMTETLRNEWGFRGFVITDQTSFPGFEYCDIVEGLEAGTDLWLNTSSFLWHLNKKEMTPTVLTNLRNSAHNVLYTIANSNGMNGMDKDSKVVSVMTGWQKLRIVIDIIMIPMIGLLIFCAVKLFRKKR